MTNNINGLNRPLTTQNNTNLSRRATKNQGTAQTPTPHAQSGDAVSISPQSIAMLNTQQSTGHPNIDAANEWRAANGLPLREKPAVFPLDREFTTFSVNALSPHMEDADRHLGLMRRAIAHPSRFAGAELNLAERTMMRESMLLEAKRIANTYLSGEDAERFVQGFKDLIHEAELIERGYVVDNGFPNFPMLRTDNMTFRSPYTGNEEQALNSFVQGNMTDEQRAEFDALAEEANRLRELSQSIVQGQNSEMTFQEALDLFNAANAQLQAFIQLMGETHNFAEQWQAFNSGSAPSDNWFVQSQANFETNSANIAEQIAEIRLNLQNELNANGANAFRSIFEQLSLSDNAMQWLTQLSIFNTAN